MSATKDALELAYGMLQLIEGGASLTTEAWDERMAKIETTLGKDTWRTRGMKPASCIVTARNPRKIRREGASR